MDTVALLGPNIRYEIKSTFVHVEEDRSSSRRSLSAPPKCHWTQPCDAVGKRVRIELDRELSQCSTTASAASDADDGATLRIGNLPNRAKPERVKAFIDDLGLGDFVTSIYIPLDSKTGVGKGYAFVHFASEAVASEFVFQAGGRRLPRSNSPKEMIISFASRQAAATVPKHLGKRRQDGRSITALLWIKDLLPSCRAC